MNVSQLSRENAYRYVRNGISVIITFSLFVLISCQKETGTSHPKVVFNLDSGFVFRDTTLSIGNVIHVGIKAQGNGANLTFFHISWNNGTEHTLLDSGLNQPSFIYDMSITKSANESEIWKFIVMDRDRNFSSVQLTLIKDSSSHYGPIRTFRDILLGAQDNTGAGSFYSIGANRRFTLDEAYLRQDSVDLVYYFYLYDATFASPAESDVTSIFTGPSGIANWTVKNETRYDTTGIASTYFSISLNDSLILAAYEPVNLKRKAKYILPGMVISFRDPKGKLGLIHVKDVVQGSTGQVLIDLKIQQ